MSACCGFPCPSHTVDLVYGLSFDVMEGYAEKGSTVMPVVLDRSFG